MSRINSCSVELSMKKFLISRGQVSEMVRSVGSILSDSLETYESLKRYDE